MDTIIPFILLTLKEDLGMRFPVIRQKPTQ
jgi:hypothetical protein